MNVEFDTSSTEENQDKYDPSVSVPLSMQKSEEISTNGTQNTGVPGTSSNLPNAKTSPATAPDPQPGQSSKSESANYGVNRTTLHVVQPAGRVHRLTAAVVVDDIVDRKQDSKGRVTEVRRKRSFEEMKLVTELAQAAIGYNATRGDVVSVQNLTFHQNQDLDPMPLTFAEKAKNGLKDYSSLVRYGSMLGGLLLVLLFVVRPLQRSALASQPEPAPAPLLLQPTEPQMQPQALAPAVTEDDIFLRSLTLKKQLAEFVKKEPESSATAVRAWLREESL